MQELKQLRKVTRITKIQLVQFQATTLNRLARDLVLRTLHERMRDFGYSEKIIQGTTVSGIDIVSKNRFKIFFKSEYFADNGFDVAIAREKGTARHFIRPVKKKALRFDGDKFSKGHFVDGILQSNIIANTLDEIAESFLDSYRRIKREWMQQNFGRLAEIAV